jgi:hypothetical protein
MSCAIERGVTRYCEFRRHLGMRVPKSFAELTPNPIGSEISPPFTNPSSRSISMQPNPEFIQRTRVVEWRCCGLGGLGPLKEDSSDAACARPRDKGV